MEIASLIIIAICFLAIIIVKSKVLKAILFGLMATSFYTYVGYWVPQKETHPPKKVELTNDMSPEELAEKGRELVQAGGKGTCTNCHITPFSRAPKLEGVGALAKTRIKGMRDVDYLADSMYKPNDYVVPKFPAIMPKNPGNLKFKEVVAVIAYLQSLGGKPTVTLKNDLEWIKKKYGKPEQVTKTEKDVESDKLNGEQLLNKYGCGNCHKLNEPGKVLGPTLYDIGKKLSRQEIYQSIMDPDAVIPKGYQKGMMAPALSDFYKKATKKQINTMVDFLVSKKGEKK